MDIDTPPIPASAWSFDGVFPLPYRVMVLVMVGMWAWATNLYLVQLLGMDPMLLLGIHRTERNKHFISHLFSLCIVATTWIMCNYVLFVCVTKGDENLLMAWKILPIICIIGLIVGVICPFDILYRPERMRFLRALKRTALDGIQNQVCFSDVILGDYLTSFAKVLGDTWSSLCIVAFSWDDQSMSAAQGQCFSNIMVPVFILLPYVFRFRQCISEYTLSNYQQTRHLHNAMKYASSFPVIILSALQKTYVIAEYTSNGQVYPAESKTWFGEYPIFRLWFLSVIVNSVFSFYWDVYHDWNLHPSLLSPLHLRSTLPNNGDKSFMRHSTSIPPGSTSRSSTYSQLQYLHFADKLPYHLAMLVDFILRFTWSIKLSSHLHEVHEIAQGVYILEVLEILRRWMWFIFRLENKHMQAQNGIGGLNTPVNGHAMATLSLDRVGDEHSDEEDYDMSSSVRKEEDVLHSHHRRQHSRDILRV